MAFIPLTVPFDPIIDVIAADVRDNRHFQNAVKAIQKSIVVHNKTLHPSDELLEAWYRFKENRSCQP